MYLLYRSLWYYTSDEIHSAQASARRHDQYIDLPRKALIVTAAASLIPLGESVRVYFQVLQGAAAAGITLTWQAHSVKQTTSQAAAALLGLADG